MYEYIYIYIYIYARRIVKKIAQAAAQLNAPIDAKILYKCTWNTDCVGYDNIYDINVFILFFYFLGMRSPMFRHMFAV